MGGTGFYPNPLVWSNLLGAPYVVVTPNGPNDGGDFGPNTPGTTTAGIQEAINSLPTTTAFPVTSGGSILITAGNYSSGPITIATQGVAILVQNGANIKLANASASHLFNFTIATHNIHNCSIQGVGGGIGGWATLDGNGANQSAANNIINIIAGANMIIRDLNLINANNAAINIVSSGVKLSGENLIENILESGSMVNGIRINVGTGSWWLRDIVLNPASGAGDGVYISQVGDVLIEGLQGAYQNGAPAAGSAMLHLDTTGIVLVTNSDIGCAGHTGCYALAITDIGGGTSTGPVYVSNTRFCDADNGIFIRCTIHQNFYDFEFDGVDVDTCNNDGILLYDTGTAMRGVSFIGCHVYNCSLSGAGSYSLVNVDGVTTGEVTFIGGVYRTSTSKENYAFNITGSSSGVRIFEAEIEGTFATSAVGGTPLIIKDTHGFNPQAKFAPALPGTGVAFPLLPYDCNYVVTTATGLTGLTLDGTAVSILIGVPIYVPANHALIPTYTGSPVFEALPI